MANRYVCAFCGASFSRAGKGQHRYCSDRCRFWIKVDKNGPIVRPELGPCAVWTGPMHPDGYGSFRGQRGQPQKLAHRAAWEFEHGPIPDGLQVLHRCDNPPCVCHLFLGTHADNMADMAAKGRSGGRGVRSLGAAHPKAKLTDEIVREIRRLRAARAATCDELAARYGVDGSTISVIATGRTWRHLTS